MAPTITAKNVDLRNCEREQIQYPGAILPHGALLVVREPQFIVLQASQNTEEHFGIPAEAMLGKPLASLIGGEQAKSIRNRVEEGPLPGPPIRIAVITLGGRKWDVLAHRHDQVLFLELEPVALIDEPPIADIYSDLRASVARLHQARSYKTFLELAAHQVRHFTGFDRVMIYKFRRDGSGYVIAESLIDGETPYLGQHFPQSDVPAPAKRLFSLSWLRHQPQIDYVPVPLVPEMNPITQAPLDMSYAMLRSVSVMYTGYLKNMGTHASMVITLLRNGQLWGLIACHHHAGPKHVSYERRTACEFLGNMVSLLIAEKEDLEFFDYKLKLKNTQVAIVDALTRTEELTDVLVGGTPNILDFVHASGAAVVAKGKVSLVGQTPSEEQVQWLVHNLSAKLSSGPYSTDSIANEFPAAAEFAAVASGVLAIRLESARNDCLLWFRPEVIQTVNWAGDPHKPVDISDDGQRLLPRTSFALWVETVKLRSEPWLEIEIQAARDFAWAILEHVIRKAERLRELYLDLERSYVELDAFAHTASHDLREPLRGIHNYAQFVLEDCEDRLRPEDSTKLKTIVRLTERMDKLLDSLLYYSRISRTELKPEERDFSEIVKASLELVSSRIFDCKAEIQVDTDLPKVSTDPTCAIEVLTNLISNSLKYNDREHKLVKIGATDYKGLYPVFYVRDNGIGIDPQHHESVFTIFRRLHGANEFGGGTGAGLTIVRKIIERHGGRIWVESALGQGATFYFTLSGQEHAREARA